MMFQGTRCQSFQVEKILRSRSSTTMFPISQRIMDNNDHWITNLILSSSIGCLIPISNSTKEKVSALRMNSNQRTTCSWGRSTERVSLPLWRKPTKRNKSFLMGEICLTAWSTLTVWCPPQTNRVQCNLHLWETTLKRLVMQRSVKKIS